MSSCRANNENSLGSYLFYGIHCLLDIIIIMISLLCSPLPGHLPTAVSDYPLSFRGSSSIVDPSFNQS
jgi:hypothetical protein